MQVLGGRQAKAAAVSKPAVAEKSSEAIIEEKSKALAPKTPPKTNLKPKVQQLSEP